MKTIPYRIETTEDNFTSRAGLALLGEVMDRLRIGPLADRHFPEPGSNRGYAPSVFLSAFIVMLAEGGRCLEDVRHLRDERELLKLIGLCGIPSADAMGDWLRRHGQSGREALREVNRRTLKAALGGRRKVTLDIDATFIESHKRDCNYSYLKKRGFMPIVGHVAETGQVVASEFRAGNAAPASGNLEFIRQCMAALPAGVEVRRCRIDAAGYQAKVLELLQRESIDFAVRARMCGDIKGYIEDADARGLWRPLAGRDGVASETESVFRTLHAMNGMDEAFELVVQRTPKHHSKDEKEDPSGEAGAAQMELPLGYELLCEQELETDRYVYRAIATNMIHRRNHTPSEVVHWYNRRGECSENRIKELKNDFAAKHPPCGEFEANALYFDIAALAYNVFAHLRQGLPARYETARAPTIRLRLFDLAGKIVRHARYVVIKMSRPHCERFRTALASIRLLLPEPAT